MSERGHESKVDGDVDDEKILIDDHYKIFLSQSELSALPLGCIRSFQIFEIF